ncbi:unnamed protein product [Lactuca virosa]|uniref:Uncharacterized protein n=1 Tax=Lactuca virosa TaxID=75947 RepID=A0AAU9NB02_9ASTR|nr:unnamed protein product [Lactuca virosa]
MHLRPLMNANGKDLLRFLDSAPLGHLLRFIYFSALISHRSESIDLRVIVPGIICKWVFHKNFCSDFIMDLFRLSWCHHFRGTCG